MRLEALEPARRALRRLFSLAALLILGVTGWLLFREPQREPPRPTAEAQPATDYTLRDFDALEADENGRWSYRIRGRWMLHYLDGSGWLIEAPLMSFYPERGAPWEGVAEQARVSADTEHAKLEGAVSFTREASAQNRAMTLITRDVTLRPKARYAETAAPVEVHQEAGRIEGVGARVYMNEDRYELLSAVKGLYAPTSR